MHTENRSWGYGLAARLTVGSLAALMFGTAALMFGLPVMFGNGDHSGDWMLDVTGIVIAGFGLFLTFGLVAYVRTRISLVAGPDGTSLDATVIDGHNLLFAPRFRTIRLPVGRIRSVERRQEIFRTLGLSNMLDSLSIVTDGGERIGLFSNANGSIVRLPLETIAGAIASAARIGVTDDGTVLTAPRGLYGEASSSWTERPLDGAAAIKARRAVTRTLQILVALMMLGVALRACH